MEQANKSGWTLNSNEAKWGERNERYLEFGGRASHASAVLDDNTVVVMGGEHQDGLTSSVLLMPPRPSPQKFIAGPNMKEKRDDLAAVVCNGYLYAIGGSTRNLRILNTLERILVNDLKKIAAAASTTTTAVSLSSSSSSSTMNNNDEDDDIDNDDNEQDDGKWERVNARLSVARSGCAAVAVYNRFIVVMGGNMFFSTVDVIDTMDITAAVMTTTTDTITNTNTNNNNNTSTVASVTMVGPRMSVPRRCLGAVVLGNQIWAVGGLDTDEKALDTLEFISFHMSTTTTTTNHRSDSSNDIMEQTTNDNNFLIMNQSDERRTTDCKPTTTTSPSSSTLSFSSSWTTTTATTSSTTPTTPTTMGTQSNNKKKNVHLSIARYRHATCLIGSCLVVAGGVSHNFEPLSSVEVVDLDRHVVWKLPDLTVPRIEVSMVSISKNQLLVLGGWNGGEFLNSMESLTCVELSLPSIQQELEESNDKLVLQQQQQQQIANNNNNNNNDNNNMMMMTLEEEQEEKKKQIRLKHLFHTLVFFNLTNNVDKCCCV